MFSRNKSSKSSAKKAESQAALAEAALKAIHDGVIMTDQNGVIRFINPAAATMTESDATTKAIGLDYGLVIRLQSKEGRELSDHENPLIQAMRAGRALEPMQATLITTQSGKSIPVSISMLPEEGPAGHRIITFRNITKELEEEGEQTEFISTASHEMRTPVATIDGYLSLCLSPQTATIDERARGYLTAAQAASKHLGQLFHDLLDVTKLDDGRIKPHFEPVEMIELVKTISDEYIPRAKELKITFNFGSSEPVVLGGSHRMQQVVYGFVDVNFMREILDNLIGNALKYTPEGGSIYVNVRGDGDRVLLNVTDTGIGISADDLSHIFQKFYRVDNSDTREIGGTGLGLYITKQRVEAMGGKIWAESAFGEGSTFYVSLPRLTSSEYEKRMIVVRNKQLQPQPSTGAEAPNPQSISAMIPPTAPSPMQASSQPQSPPAPAATTPTPQIKLHPQPQAQSTLQPQPQAQSTLQPQPQAQLTPQPQPQAQLTPQPQLQAQPTPQPQPQVQPQPSPQPQPQLQAQPVPQPQPQIQLKSQLAPEPQPKTPLPPPAPPSPSAPIATTPQLNPTPQPAVQAPPGAPLQPLGGSIPQPPSPTTQPSPPTKPIQPVQQQINNNLNGDTK